MIKMPPEYTDNIDFNPPAPFQPRAPPPMIGRRKLTYYDAQADPEPRKATMDEDDVELLDEYDIWEEELVEDNWEEELGLQGSWAEDGSWISTYVMNPAAQELPMHERALKGVFKRPPPEDFITMLKGQGRIKEEEEAPGAEKSSTESDDDLELDEDFDFGDEEVEGVGMDMFGQEMPDDQLPEFI